MINRDISRLLMTNHHPSGRGGKQKKNGNQFFGGNSSIMILFHFVSLLIFKMKIALDRVAPDSILPFRSNRNCEVIFLCP